MINRSQPGASEAVPLEPAAPVNPKEMGFAIQLFQAGLRMKTPMGNSEIRGIDIGDNAAAQVMIDTMSEALGKPLVAREGRLAPRDTEIHRGAFVVLRHYDRHPLRQAIFIRTMAFHMLVSTCGRNLLEKWCKPAEQRRGIPPHPALIEAAALVRTTGHGQFDTEEFFSTVERIAKQKYAKTG